MIVNFKFKVIPEKIVTKTQESEKLKELEKYFRELEEFNRKQQEIERLHRELDAVEEIIIEEIRTIEELESKRLEFRNKLRKRMEHRCRKGDAQNWAAKLIQRYNYTGNADLIKKIREYEK